MDRGQDRVAASGFATAATMAAEDSRTVGAIASAGTVGLVGRRARARAAGDGCGPDVGHADAGWLPEHHVQRPGPPHLSAGPEDLGTVGQMEDGHERQPFLEGDP